MAYAGGAVPAGRGLLLPKALGGRLQQLQGCGGSSTPSTPLSLPTLKPDRLPPHWPWPQHQARAVRVGALRPGAPAPAHLGQGHVCAGADSGRARQGAVCGAGLGRQQWLCMYEAASVQVFERGARPSGGGSALLPRRANAQGKCTCGCSRRGSCGPSTHLNAFRTQPGPASARASRVPNLPSLSGPCCCRPSSTRRQRCLGMRGSWQTMT